MYRRDKTETELPAPITDEPWRKVLREAAELIRTRGWCQGQLTKGDAHCAVGAIAYSMTDFTNRDYWKALTALQNIVGVHTGIPTWNDHYSRTKEEVIAALEKAARQ